MKEFNHIQSIGGAVAAVESGYLNRNWSISKERLKRINDKEQIVVGVNEFVETKVSLLYPNDGGIETIDPKIENEQVKAIIDWRQNRDQKEIDSALNQLLKQQNLEKT